MAASSHITPERLVKLALGEKPSTEDIQALIVTVRSYWELKSDMSDIVEHFGASIVTSSGEEIALDAAAMHEHLNEYAERCQQASDQAYYGGENA